MKLTKSDECGEVPNLSSPSAVKMEKERNVEMAVGSREHQPTFSHNVPTTLAQELIAVSTTLLSFSRRMSPLSF